MNATTHASRGAAPVWAAPDVLPLPPDDASPSPGSGLAWLSGSSAPRRRDPPVEDAGGGVATVPRPLGGLTLPTGRVATWLPDGRWLDEDDVEIPDPDPGPVDPAEAERRRGRQRVALARVGTRLAGWPRRVLIGILLVAATLLALRPHPAPVAATPAVATASVVVAAHDLAPGTALAATDLKTTALPVTAVPAGVAGRPSDLIGRLAAGPIRRGEPVTDARVVGPGLAAGLGPGESAAVPVRLADPESAALVRPGDRVDVLGTPVAPDGTQTGGDAVEIAAGVRVLAVLGGRDAADGAVLVVATSDLLARHLAGAAVRHRLTVSVRSP